MDPSTPGTSPEPAPSTAASSHRSSAGLGTELRESLLLLTFAVGVTVGLTTAAQAVLAALS